MALTACRECSERMSDRAEFCMHCGAPAPQPCPECEAPVELPRRGTFVACSACEAGLVNDAGQLRVGSGRAVQQRQYKVVPFTTAFFSGTLDPQRLTKQLQEEASHGWKLNRTIHESKRILGLFKREAHFLVLERGV